MLLGEVDALPLLPPLCDKKMQEGRNMQETAADRRLLCNAHHGASTHQGGVGNSLTSANRIRRGANRLQ